MLKETYTTTKYTSEKGNEVTLCYDITSREVRREDNTKEMVYGVCVSKEEAGMREQDWIDGIAEDRESIVAMCQKLARGLVTPIALADVVDELT